MSRLVIALVGGVVALTLSSLSLATINPCAAAKKLCVAKKAAALLKCHNKNEKSASYTPAKFAACLQKAKDTFDGGSDPTNGCFAKLEARYPGACLTTGDTAGLEDKVDDFVDDVVCSLDPGSSTCPTPTPTATRTPTPTPTIVCAGPGSPCDVNFICCSNSCNLTNHTCN